MRQSYLMQKVHVGQAFSKHRKCATSPERKELTDVLRKRMSAHGSWGHVQIMSALGGGTPKTDKRTDLFMSVTTTRGRGQKI